MRFFLASASPRRREILEMMPFAFEVYIPHFDERRYEQSLRAASPQHPPPRAASSGDRAAAGEGSDSREAALTLAVARGKAVCAYRELKQKFPAEEILVLSADTIVVLDGEIYGKGENRERSLEMLRKLSGRMHEVVSAVWLLGDLPARDALPAYSAASAAFGVEESILEVSRVFFAPSDSALLERYVDTCRPFDKAGAYGIQDGGALLVDRIEGNYHNIMGLPLRRVYDLLRRYLPEE